MLGVTSVRDFSLPVISVVAGCKCDQLFTSSPQFRFFELKLPLEVSASCNMLLGSSCVFRLFSVFVCPCHKKMPLIKDATTHPYLDGCDPDETEAFFHFIVKRFRYIFV
jgi:hypothetical protein